MTNEELTPEEQQELAKWLEQIGYPKQEEKHGVFQFFNKVFVADDTTKASNLKEEEVTAIRNLRDAALYCETMGLDEIKTYFLGKGENIAAPSLGRDMAFIKAVITQKRELATKTKTGGKSTWLKKKEKEE